MGLQAYVAAGNLKQGQNRGTELVVCAPRHVLQEKRFARWIVVFRRGANTLRGHTIEPTDTQVKPEMVVLSALSSGNDDGHNAVPATLFPASSSMGLICAGLDRNLTETRSQ